LSASLCNESAAAVVALRDQRLMREWILARNRRRIQSVVPGISRKQFDD
jgi:hypothetical protein